MTPRFVNMKRKVDPRGELITVEFENDLPFMMKRVYFIRNVPSETRRGLHAHFELEQVALCLAGSCKMLLDDGKTKTVVTLDASTEGLYVGPMVWHEMFDFSPDCVLTMLAGDIYKENDYIRDYESFLQEARARKA